MNRILTGAVLLALSGCASVPDLGPRPIPKSVDDYAMRQTFAITPDSAWPQQRWWRELGDEQLDTLIETALRDSPSIAIARSRVSRAYGLLAVAQATHVPAVVGSGVLAQSKPSYNTGLPTPSALHGWNDTARAAAELNYEIDFWGKHRASIAAAMGEALAAKAELDASRLMLAAAIAVEYAELNALQIDRDILERTLALRERTLALVRRRHEFGYDAEADLRQAEAGPPSVRAQLVAADERISISHIRLATLTGQGPDRALQVVRPAMVRTAALGIPASLPATLLERRPDLDVVRLRAQAAAQRIDVALAQFKPSVNLVALFGQQALGAGNLFANGSTFGSIGSAVAVPLFDGGRRAGNYRLARAEYDAAAALYEATLVTALQEIATALTQQNALDARLTQESAARSANERALELAQARFTAGAADLQAVLFAEDRLLQSERAVAAIESRRSVYYIHLARALGGGWVSN